MNLPHYNHEHLIHRIGWLRAATLGANDGIISIASLMMGMSTAGASSTVVLTTGVAGLVAGAASMAAGEWVSVMSQSDAEQAELVLEQAHIERNPEAELRELAAIYEGRGLKPALAMEVAHALTEHDAMQSHARDELGITEHSQAKPLQAALASALSFLSGGVVPVLLVLLGLNTGLAGQGGVWLVAAGSVATLFATGVLSARAANAPALKAGARVALWGTLSMALSAAVGVLLGVKV